MLSLLVAVGLIGVSSLSSCKKEGCTDPKATNFDEKAKKDDGTCDYDTVVIVTPTLDGLTKVADLELDDADADVALYASGELVTGYNTLYLAATDPVTGGVLENVSFEVTPMMDMDAGHSHTTPVMNDMLASADDKGLYKISVFFVMSSMGGQWRLEIDLDNKDASKQASASLNIEVKEPSDRISGNFMAMDDSTNLFVCWMMDEDPIVGMNDFKLAVFKRESMMSFVPLDGLSIAIEPEMPTMGHGSPGNENPAGIGNGQYEGKVNFTMTGYWKVNIDFSRGGSAISSDFYLDYTL